MPEIFGRVPLQFGGGFAADGANVFFGLPRTGVLILDRVIDAVGINTGVGLLTQNINIQYQQPVNRIYEIGGPYQYYVVGRTQGNLTLGRIVGPRAVVVGFYTILGDACIGPHINLLFAGKAGCATNTKLGDGGDGGFRFQIRGPLLMSIGISVTAQDMVISEQLQFMFIALMVPGSTGSFDEPPPTPSLPTEAEKMPLNIVGTT